MRRRAHKEKRPTEDRQGVECQYCIRLAGYLGLKLSNTSFDVGEICVQHE